MENALKKKVSKKEFLKICATLTATAFISLFSVSILKNPNSEQSNYGGGPYGG